MADPGTDFGRKPFEARPFQVMAKPNGPRCNLNCTYCYYLEKEALYPATKSFRMDEAVLERFIRDYIAGQDRLGGSDIEFTWQGGEPTLLGLDFFRRAVALEEKHRPAGKTIRNSLQTNGTLLDADWIGFLKEHGFLVGLSLDGPQALHDRYRIDRREQPSFDRVMRALALLRDNQVEFNVLTVVHRHNARQPRAVYRFLKEAGVTFIQFIPAVERVRDVAPAGAAPPARGEIAAMVTPWSVLPEDYGDFLCQVFDEWISRDVGRTFVQLFDVQVGLWAGAPAQLCWFAETCGQCLALEHNGDLYACDHYVDPEYRIGNIMHAPIADLAGSAVQARFGQDKLDTLPRCCRQCEYRFACNGGCPKNRFVPTPDGGAGLNYFCASHRQFFAHAAPYLKAMAALIHRGRSAADIMEVVRHQQLPAARAGVGRNDPCPCGSGKKFKKCCGNAPSPRAALVSNRSSD
ncbi:MAG TPA: anaerobic sulfatase maturase [Xanthobacteraceae bacterium]